MVITDFKKQLAAAYTLHPNDKDLLPREIISEFFEELFEYQTAESEHNYGGMYLEALDTAVVAYRIWKGEYKGGREPYYYEADPADHFSMFKIVLYNVEKERRITIAEENRDNMIAMANRLAVAMYSGESDEKIKEYAAVCVCRALFFAYLANKHIQKVKDDEVDV